MYMSETKPTHRKHLPYHDYKERCIYHITLVCSDRAQVLGQIVGENAQSARCALTPLGAEVATVIKNLPAMVARYGEDVQVLAAVCMPEHVHFVLFVKKRMKDGLWRVIRGFKQGCNKRLRYWLERSAEMDEDDGMGGGLGKSETPNGKVAEETIVKMADSSEKTYAGGVDTLPSGVTAFLRQLKALQSERIKVGHALFEEDFDETRLRRSGQLRAMIDYVHNNPMHRWQRQHHPHWLIPMRDIGIADLPFDCIGNVNLLGLPRWQVHVRRAWTEEEKRQYQNQCVIKARRGYALVSPFISKYEAAVRDYCLKEGHSVIVLSDNGFSDYTQCPARLYDYCVKGQVLVLAYGYLPYAERKAKVSRMECVRLNEMARIICEA